MYTDEQLDQMSNSNTKLMKPKLHITEIRFKAKDGNFIESSRPENFKSGDKYNVRDLTYPLDLIVLRIRRYLTDNNDLTSNEYDNNKETVALTQAIKSGDKTRFQLFKTGPVEQLRQELSELRVIAKVYCLYEGQLRTLSVLGTSQFNKEPKPGLSLLYEYLGSFDHAQGHRAYKFHTRISPYGPIRYTKGSGYILNFSRGEAINEQERELVGQNLELLDKYFKDLKDYSAQFEDKRKDGVISRQPDVKSGQNEGDFEASLQPDPANDLPVIQQGEDMQGDINVADIPF